MIVIGNFTIRVITDVPWPLSDREVLVDVRISQDSKTDRVRIDSNESAYANNIQLQNVV